MKGIRKKFILLLLIASAIAVATLGVTQILINAYDLSWTTVDGGGGEIAGGEYLLIGAIGQPDAGDVENSDTLVEGGYLGSESQTGRNAAENWQEYQ